MLLLNLLFGRRISFTLFVHCFGGRGRHGRESSFQHLQHSALHVSLILLHDAKTSGKLQLRISSLPSKLSPLPFFLFRFLQFSFSHIARRMLACNARGRFPLRSCSLCTQRLMPPPLNTRRRRRLSSLLVFLDQERVNSPNVGWSTWHSQF